VIFLYYTYVKQPADERSSPHRCSSSPRHSLYHKNFPKEIAELDKLYVFPFSPSKTNVSYFVILRAALSPCNAGMASIPAGNCGADCPNGLAALTAYRAVFLALGNFG
jgi:hypothetical protein